MTSMTINYTKKDIDTLKANDTYTHCVFDGLTIKNKDLQECTFIKKYIYMSS